MKRIFIAAVCLAALAFVQTSCSKEDDDNQTIKTDNGTQIDENEVTIVLNYPSNNKTKVVVNKNEPYVMPDVPENLDATYFWRDENKNVYLPGDLADVSKNNNFDLIHRDGHTLLSLKELDKVPYAIDLYGVNDSHISEVVDLIKNNHSLTIFPATNLTGLRLPKLEELNFGPASYQILKFVCGSPFLDYEPGDSISLAGRDWQYHIWPEFYTHITPETLEEYCARKNADMSVEVYDVNDGNIELLMEAFKKINAEKKFTNFVIEKTPALSFLPAVDMGSQYTVYWASSYDKQYMPGHAMEEKDQPVMLRLCSQITVEGKNLYNYLTALHNDWVMNLDLVVSGMQNKYVPYFKQYLPSARSIRFVDSPDFTCLSGFRVKAGLVCLPESVTEFSNNTFFDVDSLAYDPANVKKLGKDGFNGLNNKVVIISEFEELAEGAYGDLRNAKTLEIPASVKKIGARCFHGCDRLQSLVVPETVEEIGSNFVSGLSLGNLQIKGGKFVGSQDLNYWALEKLEFSDKFVFDACAIAINEATKVYINVDKVVSKEFLDGFSIKTNFKVPAKLLNDYAKAYPESEGYKFEAIE